jgi:hypothetical protein
MRLFTFLLCICVGSLSLTHCQKTDNEKTLPPARHLLGDMPGPMHIVHFSKRLYSTMGLQGPGGQPWNATALAERFRPDFNKLNADGTLGGALRALYDMRVQDLQISLVHTRRLLEVLGVLDS